MGLDRGTRARLVTVLVLFLVLSSGFALGIATDRQLRGRTLTGQDSVGSIERERGEGERRRDASLPDSVRGRRPLLVEQVGLSDEQKVRVDSIVAFYRVKMNELHESTNEAYWAGYREILGDTRSAMRAVLSESQRQAYDSLLVEFDRRRDDRRQRDSLQDGRGPGQRKP